MDSDKPKQDGPVFQANLSQLGLVKAFSSKSESYNVDDLDAFVDNYEQQLQELDALRYTLDASEFILYDKNGRPVNLGGQGQDDSAEQQQEAQEEDILEQLMTAEEYREAWTDYFENRENNIVQPPQQIQIDLFAIPQDFEIAESALLVFKDVPYCRADESQKTKLLTMPVIPLRITLPPTYPGSSLPAVKFQSNFYSQYQWQIIHQNLRGPHWSEQIGSPLLFDWFQHCKTDLLQDVFPFLTKERDKEREPRPLLSPKITLDEFVDELINTKMIQINQEYTTCEICLSEKMGREHFIILNPCMHVFCKECVHDYCEGLISEGKVGRLKCPSMLEKQACKSNIREKDLILVGVSEETMAKYTKFSIEGALDKMDDFGYCPRCQGPAELSKRQNMGECTQCYFIFCIKCSEKYHPGTRCQNLFVPKEVITDDPDFEHGYLVGEVKRDAAYQRRLEESMTKFCMQHQSKQCPHCGTPVQKASGCNKMVCASCDGYFCWACLEKIDGYDHFRTRPECWGALEAQAAEDIFNPDAAAFDEERFTEMLEHVYAQQQVRGLRKAEERDLSACPKCNTLNVRSDRISDIFCRGCSCHYCFQCGELLLDGKSKERPDDKAYLKHFEESACYYKAIE